MGNKKDKNNKKVVNPAVASTDDVLLSNNRESKRVSMELEVTTSGQHNFFHGMTEDVSQGGLFVATTQIFPLKTRVSITLHLDGAGLEIATEVVWLREHALTDSDAPRGMGLRFLQISEDDLEKIRHFLHKKEPLFFELDD